MSTVVDGRAKATRKSVILMIRGSQEWRDWLEGLAEHCRTNASQVADEALAAHAKRVGYPERPPRR